MGEGSLQIIIIVFRRGKGSRPFVSSVWWQHYTGRRVSQESRLPKKVIKGRRKNASSLCPSYRRSRVFKWKWCLCVGVYVCMCVCMYDIHCMYVCPSSLQIMINNTAPSLHRPVWPYIFWKRMTIAIQKSEENTNTKTKAMTKTTTKTKTPTKYLKQPTYAIFWKSWWLTHSKYDDRYLTLVILFPPVTLVTLFQS